jgi:hypothetical protein
LSSNPSATKRKKKKKDQKKGYREWSGVDLTPPWWIKANSLRREEWAGSGGFSTVIIIIIKIMIPLPLQLHVFKAILHRTHFYTLVFIHTLLCSGFSLDLLL